MTEKEQILSWYKGIYVFRLGLLKPSQCFVLSKSKIPLVLADDACSILSISRDTLDTFIADGLFPVFRYKELTYLYLIDFSWFCDGLKKEVSN